MRIITSLMLAFALMANLTAQEKNLGFEITSGGSMMDYGNWKTGSFKPGDFLLAYSDNYLNPLPDEFEGKNIIMYYEVVLNNNIIHRHAYTAPCPEYKRIKINLIPDPYDNMSIVFRHDWNGNLLRALYKLSAGEHNLGIFVYFEYNGQRIYTGYGEVIYNNITDNGADLIKMAELIDKNATFDPQKEIAEWIEKNGGKEAWRKANEEDLKKSDAEDAVRNAQNYYNVTATNQCGETFTLTVNDAQTYIINGMGSVQLNLVRGKSSVVKRNGIIVTTLSDKNEGGSINVCP